MENVVVRLLALAARKYSDAKIQAEGLYSYPSQSTSGRKIHVPATAPVHGLDHVHDRILGRKDGVASSLGRVTEALDHRHHQRGRTDVAKSSPIR